jgi:replicative superfamily II helicase
LKRPVAELWASQRAALPLALNVANNGAVINLRTSAGKTRVEELAILQTLLADPAARVFYLAPFRSLALEVEYTLAASFTDLGYGVSHLYGGARVSAVDTELAAESAITIATPEKAGKLTEG